MALVGLAGGGPKRDPILAIEALQGQRPHMRAVHMVMEGDALEIGVELGGLQIRDPGRVVARGLEIEVIGPLVGAGRPGMAGMGAAPPACPVEVGGALDGAPAAEPGLEVELVLNVGVGGEGEAEGEEKNGR